MQLTGKEIIEEGIITKYCEEGIQQAGVDLRVMDIKYLDGKGKIPVKGKTRLPKYKPVEKGYILSTDNLKSTCVEGWHLEPGFYEITLMEGCKMPNNRAMTFVQRSSLLRCGCIIRSSQFDPGFETDNMGTFMQVFNPVDIEYGARVCQTLVMETGEVAEQDMYKGQFQGDRQRIK